MGSEVSRRAFLGAAGTAVAAGAAAHSQASEAADTASASRIKIVGVCCSPRKGMTTATSLGVCLDAAREASPDKIEVELIELAGMQIDGSLAAGVPLAPGHRDDFPQLVPKLSDPKVRGVIVGTPVYFGNMTSLCKAFLERCMTFRKNDFAWSDRVAGVLAVGGARNGGQELTIRSVQTALMCQEMIIVGEARPSAHTGGAVWSGAGEKVTDDEVGMASARNLGRRVAQVALRLPRASAS